MRSGTSRDLALLLHSDKAVETSRFTALRESRSKRAGVHALAPVREHFIGRGENEGEGCDAFGIWCEINRDQRFEANISAKPVPRLGDGSKF